MSTTENGAVTTASTAKVTIGGKTYEMGPLTWKYLRKAWPLVTKTTELLQQRNTDVFVDMMDNQVALLVLGLNRNNPEMTAEAIEEQASYQEVQKFQEAVTDLLVVTGMIKRELEPTPETLLGPLDDQSNSGRGSLIPPSSSQNPDPSSTATSTMLSPLAPSTASAEVTGTV